MKTNYLFGVIYNSMKSSLLIIFNIYIILFYFYYYKKERYNNYKIYNIKLENNSLKFLYFNYSGSLDYLYLNKKDYNNISTNKSEFIVDIAVFEKKIDFVFLKLEKTKIENIIILLVVFPFLKNNSSIFYQIQNLKEYNLYKRIFKTKNKKYLYKLNFTDLNFIFENFNDYIYYDWEIILENELINEIRYLINNHYNETFLKIFDKSLNLNFKRYIKYFRSDLTINKINRLMSKLFII